MEDKEKLILDFIKNNNIQLDGSKGNSDLAALAGYTSFIDSDGDICLRDVIEKNYPSLTEEELNEVDRIDNYAYDNNYSAFWSTPQAKKEYIF